MFTKFSFNPSSCSAVFKSARLPLLLFFFASNFLFAKDIRLKKDTIIIINKSKTDIDSLHILNGKIGIVNYKPFNEFNSAAGYYGATFNRGVILKNDLFRNAINGKLSHPVYLTKSCFLKPICLDGSRFIDIADFNLSDFQDSVSLVSVRFNKDAIFTNCIFRKYANFTRDTFYKALYFNFLNLKKDANFSFYQAKLPDLIDLSRNSLIPNKIDLTTCNFDNITSYEYSDRKWHYINLYATDLTKVKIDYVHFRLCFYKSFYLSDNNFTFKEIANRKVIITGKDTIFKPADLYKNYYFKSYIKRIFPQSDLFSDDTFLGTVFSCFKAKDNPVIGEFIEECYRRGRFPQALSDEEVYSIYERELKVFENEGQHSSYVNMDIEYHNLSADFQWITHLWNCYGYHKEWVLYWMLVFLSIFSVITFCKLETLVSAFDMPDLLSNKKQKDKDSKVLITKDGIAKLNKKDQLLYAFVFTASIFFPFKFDFDSLKWNTFWVIYLFIIYLSGIFCIGYLASFVLQK